MDISVVVPTYNRRETVLRTLATLFAQNIPCSTFEIIVVIDGSTDGTAEALAKLHCDCGLRILRQPNQGPSAARNAGFRAAKAPLILFLDDDMQCDQGLLAAHLEAHSASTHIVAFGALFLAENSRKSLASECFRREIGAMHLKFQNANPDSWKITDCVFSNSSIRREILEELNGFDEHYRKREDLELALRLVRKDVRPVYLPKAIARHFYEKTSADLIRDAEAFAVADMRLAIDYPDECIEGHVLALDGLTDAKRFLNGIAANAPWLVDLLLWPVCILGESFIQIEFARDLGTRALQYRRKAHWLSCIKARPRLIRA